MTHRTFLLIPALALLAVTGCATTGERWSSTGGNKDIGVVRLSYEYSEPQEPVMSEVKADQIADNRCSTWGYQRAELIPGVLRDCSIEEGNRCAVWKVTREYQCESDKGPATLAGNWAR